MMCGWGRRDGHEGFFSGRMQWKIQWERNETKKTNQFVRFSNEKSIWNEEKGKKEQPSRRFESDVWRPFEWTSLSVCPFEKAVKRERTAKQKNGARFSREVPAMLTVYKIVISFDDSFVESPCISCRLKCETVTLLARTPMMECWHDFVVLKIAIDDATEDDLKSACEGERDKVENFSLPTSSRGTFYRLIRYPLAIDDVLMSTDVLHASTFTYGDISEAATLQWQPSFSAFVTSHHLCTNFY